jgi:hypothetical protein
MITPYQVMYYGFDLNIIRSKLGAKKYKLFKKGYDQMINEGGYEDLEMVQQVYGKPGVTIH